MIVRRGDDAIGDYIVPLQGCQATNEEARWMSVSFDATTPANTAVEIWVRSGNDLNTIDQEPIYGVTQSTGLARPSRSNNRRLLIGGMCRP